MHPSPARRHRNLSKGTEKQKHSASPRIEGTLHAPTNANPPRQRGRKGATTDFEDQINTWRQTETSVAQVHGLPLASQSKQGLALLYGVLDILSLTRSFNNSHTCTMERASTTHQGFGLRTRPNSPLRPALHILQRHPTRCGRLPHEVVVALFSGPNRRRGGRQ